MRLSLEWHVGCGRQARRPIASVAIANCSRVAKLVQPAAQGNTPDAGFLARGSLPRPAVLHPAAPCGVRVVPFFSNSAPKEGVAERRQAHSSLLCRACEARRPRERNAGRPVATGTPSRRSVVAIFGRGPVLPPPAVAPEPMSDLPASDHTARWAGFRTSHAAVRAAIAGRHSPLHRQDRLRRTPPLSEDGNLSSITSLRSQ